MEFLFFYIILSLHLSHNVGYSALSPTVVEYIQHLSHFSPSALSTLTPIGTSLSSFLLFSNTATSETIKISFNKFSFPFMKSYSSLSAYNDTFASNDNPISLLALAIS